MWGRHMQIHVLEPLFNISYTFACKIFPGKIADKYMENLKQASGKI